MAYSWRFKASLLVLVGLSVLSLTALSCRPQSDATPGLGGSADLVVWGLWTESEYLNPLIQSFQESTGVNVSYKKIASVADYEKKLLSALAERRGPDVFVIHHTWVQGKRALMSPAPADVIDERALREEFVDVVAEDVMRGGEIYALPYSVDTLALYYNKDVLNANGIASSPRTWSEFQEVVERVTRVTRLGGIQQSAAAMGTAANVNRAPDLLQVLMLQSGQSIVDPDSGDVALGGEAAERSLTFYTDFANKSKKVYTWNLRQGFSIDAFSEGETVMMINYAYNIPTVRAKNPRLDFGVGPLPQIADSKVINFASYWPLAVSSQSDAPAAAWRFVRHVTGSENALLLDKAMEIPPARREDVPKMFRDPVLGVFAEQSLTAATWPRQDVVATDEIFNTMIDSVITGAATASESVRRAADQLKRLRPAAEPEQPPPEGGGPSLPGFSL